MLKLKDSQTFTTTVDLSCLLTMKAGSKDKRLAFYHWECILISFKLKQARRVNSFSESSAAC